MTDLAADVLALNNDQTDRLQAAVTGLSASQLQWVSGYTAGLAAASDGRGVGAVPGHAAVQSGRQLTILYGSQTGNGERLAVALQTVASEKGFTAKSISLADFKPASLKRESHVALVISTHGEGDPPDDAEMFYEYLMSERAPNLKALRYTVLALGDSSYANFCQTGRELDGRLEELGAERFGELLELDLDYDDDALAWSDSILQELPDLLGAAGKVAHLHAVAPVDVYNRSNPFPAKVLVNQKITGRDSSKDVRHIELSIEGSGLRYEPGDSLAVVADNPPQLVDELLLALALDGDEDVVVHEEETSLHDALSSRLEITALNRGFVQAWSEIGGSEDLVAILSDEQRLADLFDTHQVIDIVRGYPGRVGAQQFVDALRKLGRRSYSISSSLNANPDEVHLTVAAVRYDAFDRPHWGAASTHLADRVAEGEHVSVYVEPNTRFRLPEPAVPVIMIGPGTGVAPFRAFLEERVEQGATGNNWLFLGDRNFESDFLYQIEWLRYLKQGVLTKLDVAFSRDQPEKIYVQDQISENAAELYRWIKDGASIYVCGDAKKMANDVHEALIRVYEIQADVDRDAAERRLQELRRSRRYQRDVY